MSDSKKNDSKKSVGKDLNPELEAAMKEAPKREPVPVAPVESPSQALLVKQVASQAVDADKGEKDAAKATDKDSEDKLTNSDKPQVEKPPMPKANPGPTAMKGEMVRNSAGRSRRLIPARYQH